MKAISILLAASIAATCVAQYPQFPPRQSGGPGGSPSSSGTGQNSQSQQRGANSPTNSQPAANVPTEVIRVLSSSSVQQQLSLTEEELSDLRQIARNSPASTTSEDDAFSAVSRVLTTAQTAELERAMVQDLGYGAVALSAVRSKLSLSDTQSSQITTLVSVEEAAKRAILTQSSNADAAVQAISGIADIANAALAKILTPAQDSTLRKLATTT